MNSMFRNRAVIRDPEKLQSKISARFHDKLQILYEARNFRILWAKIV